MSVFYPNGVHEARSNAVVTAAGATAVLEIGTAGFATTLASFSLNNPIGTVSTNGMITLSGFPKTASITANGTAAEARIRTATGGSDVITGLTVGTHGNKDIVLETTTLAAATSLRLTSVSIQPWGAKYGTNLAGLELSSGVRTGASTRPNINFTPPRASEFTYMAKQGYSRVRLPIVWEMLQPILASSNANATVRNGYNPAIAANGDLYQRYRDWITDVLDAAAAAGMTVLLDLHNYCRYQDFVYNADGSVTGYVAAPDVQTQPYASSGTFTRIFSNAAGATLPVSDFVNVWTKIVNYWGNWGGTGPHPGLGGYGLMNEPFGLPAAGSIVEGTQPEDKTILPTYFNAAISAIRAVDGVTPIYVSGYEWSGTFSWEVLNPGFPLSGTNLIYEGHVYIDKVGDGHHFDWLREASIGATVNTGVDRVQPFINWCKKHRVKGCIGETGMPLGNSNWQTSFLNFLAVVLPANMDVFTWAGGGGWTYRAYPINQIAQWHHHKTVEPEVSGAIHNALGIQQASLFVDGDGYGLDGSLAVKAVTIRLHARGNTATGVTVTVASDNGGTFSPSSTVNIAAGANQSASFTFTPGATGRTTKLTFTVSSPTGIAAPPDFYVYSHTDPVTLSATDLTAAARTLMAKYSMAQWNASDAYTDFMDGAACTNSSYARAISDVGYMSKYDNPMEMTFWYNTNVNTNSYFYPPVFGTDGGGKKYLEYDGSTTFGLWCKKQNPIPTNSPNPQQRMRVDLDGAHFAIVAFTATNAAASGSLFRFSSSQEGHFTGLELSGAQPIGRFEENGGKTTSIAGTAVALNTVTVCSITSKNTLQQMRQQSVLKGTGGLSYTAAMYFDSMNIGGASQWSYPFNLYYARIYCAFAGLGDPTSGELGVLEKYASSLSGGSL